MTSKNPDELSTTFVENLGANVAVVHPLGPLYLSDAATIGFNAPFFYNPSDGNLLLEIKNFDPPANPQVPQATPGPLDAYDVPGDSISRVYARGDANATTGITDTLGLTTYFVVVPLPELSVSLQSDNLVIYWPRGLVEFTLQQSSVLGADASWHQTAGIVKTNGNDFEVTLPIDPTISARFFRLISQDLSATADFHPNIKSATLNQEP